MQNEETGECTRLSVQRMTYLGGLGYRPVNVGGWTYIRVPDRVYQQELAALETLRDLVARQNKARRLAAAHAG
jgi:hypothetical protein